MFLTHKVYDRNSSAMQIKFSVGFNILCAAAAVATFPCSKLWKHSFESGQNGLSECKTAAESRKSFK